VSGLAAALAPSAYLLVAAVLVDLAIGDPKNPWHPIRVVGHALSWLEGRLRDAGLDGYGGGVLLFILLSTISIAVSVALIAGAAAISFSAALAVHAFILYSLLALGDLLHHVWAIEKAARDGDLPRARAAVSALVGRDTDRMDAGGCRRAGVESLSENLTDGFVSPLFWYVLGGVPGLVLFKVVSTMDSMVGYKTPRYLQFGWCGARLDDVMNFLPARLTWLMIAALATVLPTYSGSKAWTVGLQQHAVLLGPNSGWSEAAIAGALQRKIVGPIYLRGAMVTDVWIGEPSDPPLERGEDVRRAMWLAAATGICATVGAVAAIRALWNA
jgi:adenosylcobinamide-phosphate synthase